MADKRFHLGWFMNFTTNEWNTPFGNDGMPLEREVLRSRWPRRWRKPASTTS